MRFETHELGNALGIIHIQINNDRLSWDFPLGSAYDLCAVFDRQRGKTLRELQLVDARPFLYHKCLKTSCRFIPQNYNEGFLLFPARIKDGILDIGNQTHGQNALHLTGIRTIQIRTTQLKKGIFRESLKVDSVYDFSEADLSYAAADGMASLYYKIYRNDISDNTTYRLPVTQDTVQIIISSEEKVCFFKDEACKISLKPEVKVNE